MNAGRFLLLLSLFLVFAREAPASDMAEAGTTVIPAFVAVDSLPGTEKTLAALENLVPKAAIIRLGEGETTELPEETGAVIAVRQAEGTETKIVNGRRGSTSPRWLLAAAAGALDEAGERFVLSMPRMPVYRLGWIADDPDLDRASPADIPVILVEVPAGGSAFLPAAAERLSAITEIQDDRHYLTFRFRDKLFIPGEETLVTLMIGVFSVVFFNLFFLSFSYGRKSEQHLRDFFRVWWLPFFYFAATLLSLAAGQAFSSWLMTLVFGDPGGWTVIPERAFAGKLIFAFFFTSVLVTFNQLIPFPKGGFIYGYIAGIVCLVNIFVFLYLDFSLSVLFALVFGLAYALTHVRNTAVQIGGLVLLIAPFFPYIRELARGDSVTLAPLYSAGFAWNARLSLIMVPFQLFMTRLTHSVGVFKAKRGVHVPLLPIAALIPAIVFTAFLVLAPAWTPERPLPVQVSQNLTETGLKTDTSSKVGKAHFTVVSDPEMAAGPDLEQKAAVVLNTGLSVHSALGRNIVTVSVTSALPLDSFSLEVSSEETGAVLASSRDFERSPSGDITSFIVEEPGIEPFSIVFTAVSGSRLDLNLSARTTANPWGVTIRDPSISVAYELSVSRIFSISEDGTVSESEGP